MMLKTELKSIFVAVLLCLITLPVSAAVLEHYYDFRGADLAERLQDKQGGYGLTMEGTVPITGNGIASFAGGKSPKELDPCDSYLWADIPQDSDQFVVSLWFKLPDGVSQDNYAGIFSSHVPKVAGDWQLDYYNGNLRIAGDNTYTVMTAPSTGIWHYMAIMSAPDSWSNPTQVWIDGGEVAKYSGDTGNLLMAVLGSNRNRDVAFEGDIASVRIYSGYWDSNGTNARDEYMLGPDIDGWVWTVRPDYPQNGENLVKPDAGASWFGDGSAVSYNIFFGTDPCSLTFVENSINTSISFEQLAQAIGLNILSPATTYYWKIDMLDGNDMLISSGGPWSFKTVDYFGGFKQVVEDFFDSADNWVGSGGSTTGYVSLTNIMQWSYDNSSVYPSEVTRTFSPAGNWTHYGLSTLNIKMLGKETNSAEPVYIVVSDGNDTYKIILADANIQEDDKWQMLSVPLSDFEDNNIDLSNVQTLTIGIGSDVAAGGSGQVFIGDIVLITPRCLDKYASVADVTDDCQVNEEDLSALSDSWLYEDFMVNAVAPAASPIAYYDFNDASGYSAADSSGNGHNAAIEPSTVSGFWDSSGHNGYCLLLNDPNLEVNIPSVVFNTISNEMTISMWIYGQAGSIPNQIETVEMFTGIAPAASNIWDRLQWDIVSAPQYEGWNHYALVKDASADLMQIYVNGILVAQNTNASEVLSGSSAGATILSLVPGWKVSLVKIDDLKIYNAALSQSEIVYLAMGGLGSVQQPISSVLTDVNIAGNDGSVNLKDFAEMANEWLKSQMW